MVLGRLRERYEELMKPIGEKLSSLGLTPNLVSFLSLLAGFGSGWLFMTRNLVGGFLALLFMGVLDTFDGSIARAAGSETRFGAVLDHVLDRYAEYFILAGIVLGGFADWFTGIFALFGMAMASYTRAKAESLGGLRSCTVGLAERQEKLGIFLIGSLASLAFPSALFWATFLVGALSHVTVAQRLLFTWQSTGGR